MKVVFLVGGKGTRLGLKDIPKPMVNFADLPLLERSLKILSSQGFKDIVFFSGHLSHKIEEHFGDGKKFNVSISHFNEDSPLGTAGPFRINKKLFREPFLVIYGDLIFDVDLNKFINFGKNKGGIGSIFIHPNDHPYDSDLVEINSEQRITAIHSKPHNLERYKNLVNAAIYYLDPKIIDFIPENYNSDWGKDIFNIAIKNSKKLYGYNSSEYVKDIGTPERIKLAETDFLNGKISSRNYLKKQKAIFLDRDGVINKEINGVFFPTDLLLCDNASTAIKKINNSQYLCIVITNQPGIAKGFFTKEELNEVHKELETQISNSNGSFFDDIYFCPHHPESGFDGEIQHLKVNCQCRKPNPGMILDASIKHNIDLHKSYLIGDRMSDVNAAISAGVNPILIDKNINKNMKEKSYILVDNILEAVERILN